MAQFARPNSDDNNSGSWSSTGSSLYSVVDESGTANDSDYISVSDDWYSGSALSCTLGLSSVTDPSDHSSTSVVVRAQTDAFMSGYHTLTVTLKSGSDTIKSEDFDASTSWTNHTMSLSTSQAADIDDYTDLSVIISATDNAGGATMKVSQVYFTCPDLGPVEITPAHAPAAATAVFNQLTINPAPASAASSASSDNAKFPAPASAASSAHVGTVSIIIPPNEVTPAHAASSASAVMNIITKSSVVALAQAAAVMTTIAILPLPASAATSGTITPLPKQITPAQAQAATSANTLGDTDVVIYVKSDEVLLSRYYGDNSRDTFTYVVRQVREKFGTNAFSAETNSSGNAPTIWMQGMNTGSAISQMYIDSYHHYPLTWVTKTKYYSDAPFAEAALEYCVTSETGKSYLTNDNSGAGAWLQDAEMRTYLINLSSNTTYNGVNSDGDVTAGVKTYGPLALLSGNITSAQLHSSPVTSLAHTAALISETFTEDEFYSFSGMQDAINEVVGKSDWSDTDGYVVFKHEAIGTYRTGYPDDVDYYLSFRGKTTDKYPRLRYKLWEWKKVITPAHAGAQSSAHINVSVNPAPASAATSASSDNAKFPAPASASTSVTLSALSKEITPAPAIAASSATSIIAKLPLPATAAAVADRIVPIVISDPITSMTHYVNDRVGVFLYQKSDGEIMTNTGYGPVDAAIPASGTITSLDHYLSTGYLGITLFQQGNGTIKHRTGYGSLTPTPIPSSTVGSMDAIKSTDGSDYIIYQDDAGRIKYRT